MSGAGSAWNNGEVVNVGNIGNGTLTIDTGGQVSAAGLNIATRCGILRHSNDQQRRAKQAAALVYRR